jgi:hypothetical protein
MKKMLIVSAFAVALLSGCAEPKTIQGVTYQPYGLVNQGDLKNPDIAYRLPIENVIFGALFCETIVVPVYIVGWDLYEPVGIKPPVKGVLP